MHRITGAYVAEPHSCADMHLHSVAPEGIRIDGLGPFPDPDPEGCGIATVVTR